MKLLPTIYVVSGFTVDSDEAGNSMQTIASELAERLGARAVVRYREYDDGTPAGLTGSRTALVAHSYGMGHYGKRFLAKYPDTSLLFSIDGVNCPLAGWPIGWLTRAFVAWTGWGKIRVPGTVGDLYVWRQCCHPPRGSRIEHSGNTRLRQEITFGRKSTHGEIITQATSAVQDAIDEWLERLLIQDGVER